MQIKVVSILKKSQASRFEKRIREAWNLDKQGNCVIDDEFIRAVDVIIAKDFPALRELGDLKAWLPLYCRELTGKTLIADIDTSHEKVVYELTTMKDSVGFVTNVSCSVKRSDIISEETLKYISPTVGELQEGMQILVEIPSSSDSALASVTPNGRVEEATDVLEGVIKGLDKLTSNEIKVEESDGGWTEEPEEVSIFYPKLDHISLEALTKHKVDNYIETRRSFRWICIQLKDLYEGNFKGVVEAILPISLHPTVMLRRMQSLSSAIQQQKITQAVYDAIVTPRILKGRTTYNSRAVLFVSEVIQELDKVLTRVPAEDRLFVSLPLLALVLCELKQTGLLAIDFNFAMLIPIPEKVSSEQIVLKHMLIQEMAHSFEGYALAMSKVKFGESIVSSYDIAQMVSGYRHMLGEDMLNLEHTVGMYSTIKKIAAAKLFDIPTKLMQLHPTIKNAPVLQVLLGIYDFAMEVCQEEVLLSLQGETISYEEANEVINWFSLRAASIKPCLKPLKDFKNRFSILSRPKQNGVFSNVIIYRDDNAGHVNDVASFVKYGSASAFAVYKKRREEFEKRINGLGSRVTSSLAGRELFDLFEKELNRGYLPPYTGIFSGDERDCLLLATCLNNCELTVGHKSVMSELTDGDRQVVAKTNVIPIDPKIVFSIPTDGLKVNGGNFLASHITVEDPLTFLWSHIQSNNIKNVGVASESENLGLPKLPEGTRILMPFAISPKTLECMFKLQISVGSKSFDVEVDTRQIFSNEVVVGSSMLPHRSASTSIIKALTVLQILRAIGFRNLEWHTQNSAVSELERSELACQLLKTLFNESLELKNIVNRVIAHIELRIAREIGQQATELDILSLKQMRNEVSVQVLACITEWIGVMPVQYVNNLLEDARKARAWYAGELFS